MYTVEYLFDLGIYKLKWPNTESYLTCNVEKIWHDVKPTNKYHIIVNCETKDQLFELISDAYFFFVNLPDCGRRRDIYANALSEIIQVWRTPTLSDNTVIHHLKDIGDVVISYV